MACESCSDPYCGDCAAREYIEYQKKKQMITLRRNAARKYEVTVELSWEELRDRLTMEAECASVDVPALKKGVFHIFHGDLYGTGAGLWYFFDASVRKWQLCDDPRKES